MCAEKRLTLYKYVCDCEKSCNFARKACNETPPQENGL